MSTVKKIPMESTFAEFWKVVFMPDPAPRCSGGRLLMTPARFGEPKEDIASHRDSSHPPGIPWHRTEMSAPASVETPIAGHGGGRSQRRGTNEPSGPAWLTCCVRLRYLVM